MHWSERIRLCQVIYMHYQSNLSPKVNALYWIYSRLRYISTWNVVCSWFLAFTKNVVVFPFRIMIDFTMMWLISVAVGALNALKSSWKNLPPNWRGADPCGNDWDGISCTNTRVTSMLVGVSSYVMILLRALLFPTLLCIMWLLHLQNVVGTRFGRQRLQWHIVIDWIGTTVCSYFSSWLFETSFPNE